MLGLLGRGGMGSVYLSRTAAGRRVAVKIVHADLAADPRYLRMFDREARLARRVARFCTAEVLDSGVEEGRPYLVTEFVDGMTLWDAVARNGPLSGGALERLAVAVATALTAIHDAGMIHRDLKPSNILLAEGGPLVIDFGIAHALDGTVQLTGGRIDGTPAFMAPEQARGGDVGPAADVFAWGGVVTYAATGRPPFGVGSADALLYRVVHERPDLDGVPSPLRAVVEATMRSDAALRPTARQLYDQLLPGPTAVAGGREGPAAREPTGAIPRSAAAAPSSASSRSSPTTLPTVLLGRPGAARPARGGPRQGPGAGFQFLARHRYLMPALAAAVALAAATPFLVLGRDGGSGAAADPTAISRRLATEALRLEAQHLETQGLETQGAEPTNNEGGEGSGDGLARRLAVAAYRIAPTSEARDSLYATSAPHTTPLLRIPGGDTGIGQVQLSPDGTLLATTSVHDSVVRLWDTSVKGPGPPVPVATLEGHDDGVSDVEFSPDGRLIATGDGAVGPGQGVVRLWDTAARGTPAPLAVLAGHTERVSDLAFSPDGKLLATTSDGDGGMVRLWATDSRGVAEPLVTFVASVWGQGGVVFSPDSKLLATVPSTNIDIEHDDRDSSVRLWDTSSRDSAAQPVAVLTGRSGGVGGGVFSPDGMLLATIDGESYGDAGDAVRLWDARTRGHSSQPVATLAGGVSEVVFNPDSTTLATVGFGGNAGDDGPGMFRLWDASSRGTTDQTLATLTGNALSPVSPIAFSPDGTLLATAGGDSFYASARLWQTSTRGAVDTPLATLEDDVETPVQYNGGISFDAAGTLLATSNTDGYARLWDLVPDDLIDSACDVQPTNELTAQEWKRYVPELPYNPPCPD